MQLNANQLEQLQKDMEEEHRRDRDALERLTRFMKNGSGRGFQALSSQRIVAGNDNDDDSAQTIIGKVAEVIASDPEKKWTVPKMLTHLKAAGFPLQAKTPLSTLGLVFKKLQRRGHIRIAKRGAGRNPHVWRAVVPQEGDISTKSERATQGQPAHLQ